MCLRAHIFLESTSPDPSLCHGLAALAGWVGLPQSAGVHTRNAHHDCKAHRDQESGFVSRAALHREASLVGGRGEPTEAGGLWGARIRENLGFVLGDVDIWKAVVSTVHDVESHLIHLLPFVLISSNFDFIKTFQLCQFCFTSASE